MYIFIKGEVFFGEKYMKKIITMSFFLVFTVSCGQSEAPSGNNLTFDVVGVEFYNEFIPCVGGEDFNQENVDKMMKGWRSLNISDDLLGAWGYVPATEGRFDNGWWELSWESKEAADAAWAEWVQDEEAMAFLAANESVMVCDGEERAAWDMTFHRDVYSFGPTAEDGSFYSEFFPCKYNDGKSSDDLMESIALYNKWLDGLDASGFYAYGIYAGDGTNELADFWWGNFHESSENAASGAAAWLETGGTARVSLEATATCGVPDGYDSGVIYDPSQPQFSKS
ncbi:MAG TPA: hypothetical protein DCL68_05265 [Gammaproteobacteria bacterium]|nr:hypothetical protein [Gammaproteobacteria bacterium]|tara:strand:+ start:5660 stop:6505 length:846 start_codon:yes stop_codon:yes gene_type:complete